MFLFHFQDSNAETVILISPKFGISQINSLRNSVVSNPHLFHYLVPLSQYRGRSLSDLKRKH